MKGSYGRAFWGVQGSKGTVAPAFSALGIIDRPHANTRSGIEALFSVGDWDAVELSEGMTLAEVGLSITALEDIDFATEAKRNAVTGELNWLSFRLGYIKGGTAYRLDVIDCKLDTMTLRCDAGGRVNADFTAIGGAASKSAVDPGDMSFFASRAYRWFELTWDEVRDLRAFEFNVRNNLDPVPVIAGSGTTRTPERTWDYLDEGSSDLGGTLTYFLEDATVDLQDCLIPGADHTLTLESCSDVSPVQQNTLVMNGLKLVDDDIQIPAQGDILIEVPFLCMDWTLS